jgi:hypothetical protein
MAELMILRRCGEFMHELIVAAAVQSFGYLASPEESIRNICLTRASVLGRVRPAQDRLDESRTKEPVDNKQYRPGHSHPHSHHGLHESPVIGVEFDGFVVRQPDRPDAMISVLPTDEFTAPNQDRFTAWPGGVAKFGHGAVDDESDRC